MSTATNHSVYDIGLESDCIVRDCERLTGIPKEQIVKIVMTKGLTMFTEENNLFIHKTRGEFPKVLERTP